MFVIFFLEMVIKMIGFGPTLFVKDYYNIFDALIGKISCKLIKNSDLKYN